MGGVEPDATPVLALSHIGPHPYFSRRACVCAEELFEKAFTEMREKWIIVGSRGKYG
ncbi:hypothetical protein AKJ09_07557 [Labilithrix luteola]|uniref:Uncharacterized protein n=1 Tax=Labilithrix luteola TaxID=1391654 RepID=A0A0K1Q5A0_9BACT|nr:hypothetical protein AKJ09_07557 [Labilithrix luteola]